MTGEPADARRKRRRGPDGAAVDGESVDVGRSNHGVEEADARSKSVGAGRPVHGVPVHGVKEANARVESAGVGRPSTGKERPASGARVLVLAVPSARSPSTG
jgi:hypothetical protein